ncbi:MAG: nucleoside triphosphate pyrophosphohydrolase [Firmicutes bacterium]|nr:nucleoside triphosphate pyrophosphohydrolase [Bacillota bacterium]
MKEKYEHLIKSASTDEEAITRLKEIVAILRIECPWDKKQTHETLRSCMIEEAYEVVEAINVQNDENLEEELGDVMLQVVFHSNLAEEKNRFNLTDVINKECEKMIRRHPHVFLQENSNNDINSIDKVLEKWENIKAAEKQTQTAMSRMDSVPRALPALTRATKIQKRAAEVGFDWDDISGALDKVKEETEEVIQADRQKDSSEHIAEELGDLLFAVVNVARFLKVDPEEALDSATRKFIRRFSYVEQQSLACGKQLENMSLEEMDELWDEAKRLERNIKK